MAPTQVTGSGLPPASAPAPAPAPALARAASWLVLAAIGLLAVPTLARFATTFWSQPDDTHEPVVFAGLLVAFWCERKHFGWDSGRLRRTIGTVAAVLGSALYALGRSQMFYQMEGLGLVFFVVGILLHVTNRDALPRISLLVLLCCFLIPVPGTLLDGLLLPIKLFLTGVIVQLLALFNYPIASHGVIISIGFYQLQVANACAGLRSLLALSAIGLMFVYFIREKDLRISAAIIAMIPIIALTANFGRLLTLVLLTYYFGGDLGERAHELAGYGELLITLALFVCTRQLASHALTPKLQHSAAHRGAA